MQDIDKVLNERGSRYGNFETQALITQDLKRMIRRYAMQQDTAMSPDQWEALDMICSKIARILNGDPDYDDSWVDIAGYAQLIVNRLRDGKLDLSRNEQKRERDEGTINKSVEELMREAANMLERE